jgi:hypothetical protein
MSRPAAIGYLRRDVSGGAQAWHETQMRSLAKRLGYDFAKTVVFGASTGDPIGRLRMAVQYGDVEIEAVIVPGEDHFEGGVVPDSLIQLCDVITVTPQETYSRSNPELFGE